MNGLPSASRWTGLPRTSPQASGLPGRWWVQGHRGEKDPAVPISQRGHGRRTQCPPHSPHRASTTEAGSAGTPGLNGTWTSSTCWTGGLGLGTAGPWSCTALGWGSSLSCGPRSSTSFPGLPLLDARSVSVLTAPNLSGRCPRSPGAGGASSWTRPWPWVGGALGGQGVVPAETPAGRGQPLHGWGGGEEATTGSAAEGTRGQGGWPQACPLVDGGAGAICGCDVAVTWESRGPRFGARGSRGAVCHGRGQNAGRRRDARQQPGPWKSRFRNMLKPHESRPWGWGLGAGPLMPPLRSSRPAGPCAPLRPVCDARVAVPDTPPARPLALPSPRPAAASAPGAAVVLPPWPGSPGWRAAVAGASPRTRGPEKSLMDSARGLEAGEPAAHEEGAASGPARTQISRGSRCSHGLLDPRGR